MSKNDKFSYDPTEAYKAIVGDDEAPKVHESEPDPLVSDPDPLVQKNVRFRKSQIKQMALMALDRETNHGALLREAWDEYYLKHTSSDSD